MTCIIIDDEPLAREGMKINVDALENLQLLGTFSSALSAHAFLKENQVDLIFLDINMPHLTGLEFVRSLSQPPMIIFTTACPEYAVESYEVSAIDFLTKPIRFQRFFQAVTKAEERLHSQNQNTQNTINQLLENETNNDFVFIKADRRTHKVALSDIYYIEGLKDYVIVHTKTEKLITALNIKTIHAQLPQEKFFRINKSYIANLEHIRFFDSDFATVHNEQIPIGMAYREDFLACFVGDKLLKR